MKKFTFLFLFMVAALSASATISWMGNHVTGSQPNNSQTIHFYVEMYDKSSGSHAEVVINAGGTWNHYTLTQGADNGSNSTWVGDIVVPSTSTQYYFHGWDNGTANVYDSNNSNNYSISINPTTTSGGDGLWNSANNWCDGTVPTSTTATYVIANNLTLNSSTTVGALTINSGTTFTASDGTARTLTISNGGKLVNNGTFTSGTSTVAFAGTGTVSGTVGFNNVTLAGGVDFGTGSTVTRFLNIHMGGYVNTNAPTYAIGSTLKYNSGTTYGASAEWTTNTTTGAGVPSNVVIGDEIASSGVTFGSSSAYRYASGNVTISSTTSGSSLTLSSVSGGDLQLAGDFTNNGTFNASNRAIFFIGGNTQNVNGTQTNINYVIINKTGGSVNVVTNLISDVLTLTAGTLNVNAGKQLTVNTTLTNNGTLNLLSDGTYGTATILTPASIGGSGTATIQQYLGAARNWYMSSPVLGATSLPSVDTGTLTFYSYPENDANQGSGANGYAVGAVWNTVSTGTMALGTGYIVKPSNAASTVKFTGTSLNTGDQSISSLTNSTTTNPSMHGYNLIGNPYPSYLNVLPSILNNTNLDPTVWYRTLGTESTPKYHFETVNATTGVGTNNAGTGQVTGYIPPMQAFWVHTNADAQTITLLNTNRSHAGNVTLNDGHSTVVSTTLLKSRASETNTQGVLLRLKVSDGNTGDETIIYTNANASNGYDNYDSQKMSNNNAAIPEIYTTVGNENLVINGLNSITQDTEIPLGFTTGQSNTFSIKASEISNLDSNTKVYLKDNLLSTEQDLTDGTAYTFASDAASTTSRFSIVFKSVGITTGVQTASGDKAVLIYKNANNQIAVNCTGTISSDAFVSVYNALGQKLELKQITSSTTVIGKTFTSGVYVVIVNNGGKSTTKKVILN